MSWQDRYAEREAQRLKRGDWSETPKVGNNKKSNIGKKQTSKKFGIVSKIALITQAITGVLAIYSLFHLNILALWQEILITVAIIGLQALTIFKTVRNKPRRGTRYAFCALAIILAIVYGAVYYYAGQLSGFLSKVTGGGTEKQEYSVIVLKSSNYRKIADVGGMDVGFQQANPHLKEAEDKLTEVVKYTPREYSDMSTLEQNLTSSTVAAVSMPSSTLDTIKEEDASFYGSVRVIYTYNIEIKKAAADNTDIAKEPSILYISGTDSRHGISDTGRSDVNMLAVINPKQQKILLVSVPRDYYVQLHGTTGTKDKLTHAGIYGIEMSKNTMEDLFGIKINNTAKVSFDTVKNLVDAVGGIDIYSDQAFTAWTDPSCKFTVGQMHVGGKCALAFARERKAYASGDRHRVQNQQMVLAAILDKATSPQYLANYPSLLQSIDGTFRTSLSYDQITSLAQGLVSTGGKWKTESISVDGTGSMQPTYSMGAQPLYVMIPDQKTVDAAKAKINEYLEKD